MLNPTKPTIPEQLTDKMPAEIAALIIQGRAAVATAPFRMEVPDGGAQYMLTESEVVAVNWLTANVSALLAELARLHGLADQHESQLVNATSQVLGSAEWEDHHAVSQISAVLDCTIEDAAHLMALAIHRFPGLKVKVTT